MIATVTGVVSYQYDDEAFDDFTDEELIETSREAMIQSPGWAIEWTVVREEATS